MPLLNVALIEIEVLFAVGGCCRSDLQIGIAFEDAFLLTVGLKLIHGNARRHASIAILAMRAVEMVATASKAHFRQVSVDINVHGLARVEEQRRSLFGGQVAARVGLSGIKLQSRQLGHGQPSRYALD